MTSQLATNSESATGHDSSEFSTPSSLAGKYQFIKKLGQGSQAKVFLARRLCDNQTVAIKQIDIESVSNWKEYDLFQREVNVLSSLDINGVALFYEAIECLDDTPPRSYLVQEYIAGESLGAMLKAGHRFSTDVVYDIIIQLLTILYQLQNRTIPIIHRDIKPSNIMLTPVNGGYYVTLIDFGAVANPQVQSGGSTTAGTFGYMPPEQLMCKPQPASDIYALGAVAVELFTGKSPADLPTKDFHLIFEHEMQSQPPALVSTLRKMLEPDCTRRLSDCVQLIQTFKYYKKGEFKLRSDLTPLDSAYSKKLQEVTSFGAPGNIDLWQALDDKTPREIPQAYARHNWIVQNNTQKVFNLKKDSTDKENKIYPIPEMVSDLLKFGRKTIATIVSIKYVPVANSTQLKDLMATPDKPAFRVRYKFNPPDDFRSEDLIHECMVYNEPENTYRVGDPFPILYYLDGENFDEVVISMPFPYPLEDISESSIVYWSTPGEEYWSYLKALGSCVRYDFITHRNDLPRLANEIDKIKSHEWMTKTEYQYAVLPILNCYLKAEKYALVHINCLNCFFDCLRRDWFIEQINAYILNYLCRMKIRSEEIYKALFANVHGKHNLSSDVVSKIVDMIGEDCVAYQAMMSPFSPKLAAKILERNSLKHIHARVFSGLCEYIKDGLAFRESNFRILCDYLNKRPIDESVISPSMINSIGWCKESLLMSAAILRMLLRSLVGIYFDSQNAALRRSVREQIKAICEMDKLDKRYEYYLNALDNPQIAADFKIG